MVNARGLNALGQRPTVQRIQRQKPVNARACKNNQPRAHPSYDLFDEGHSLSFCNCQVMSLTARDRRNEMFVFTISLRKRLRSWLTKGNSNLRRPVFSRQSQSRISFSICSKYEPDEDAGEPSF